MVVESQVGGRFNAGAVNPLGFGPGGFTAMALNGPQVVFLRAQAAHTSRVVGRNDLAVL